MDFDFSTKERVDEIEILQFDDLAYRQTADEKKVEAPSKNRGTSWLSLMTYWIGELRWRRKFWKRD